MFTLSANHLQLPQEVVDWFAWAAGRTFRDRDYTLHMAANKGHGRLEIRQCNAPENLVILRHVGFNLLIRRPG